MISIYTGSYQQILKRIKRKNLRKNARGPAEIESLESRKLCNNVNIITLGVIANDPVVGPHTRAGVIYHH